MTRSKFPYMCLLAEIWGYEYESCEAIGSILESEGLYPLLVDRLELSLSSMHPRSSKFSPHKDFESCNDRHYLAMYLRFGLDGRDPLTYAEIGSGMGVTVERVRQMVAKNFRLLRYPRHSSGLKPFARAFNAPPGEDYHLTVVGVVVEALHKNVQWVG